MNSIPSVDLLTFSRVNRTPNTIVDIIKAASRIPIIMNGLFERVSGDVPL
jgi:hypothetical protein